ncbi:MAG: YceI family protein, partial [Candidatus Rokubacteria bacterium]|nr:YceI family protein [Candidatus Rokubacteria bacterium]
ETYPTSKFVATAIKPAAETEGASHTITGNLTLHGVTKSITFPATIAVTDTEVTLKSEFSIKKSDFGITFSGPGGMIYDEVLLKLDVKAPRTQG